MDEILNSPYGKRFQEVATFLGVEIVGTGAGHGQSVPTVYFELRIPGSPTHVRWLRSLRRTQDGSDFEAMHIEMALTRLQDAAAAGFSVPLNPQGYWLG